jgi:hypothetical protein
VSALIIAKDAADKAGVMFNITGAQRPVLRVFEITGVIEHLHVRSVDSSSTLPDVLGRP